MKYDFTKNWYFQINTRTLPSISIQKLVQDWFRETEKDITEQVKISGNRSCNCRKDITALYSTAVFHIESG